MSHPEAQPYIITLTSIDGADVERLLGRLRGLGVELDELYGVIPMGPAPSSFVTRGMIPPPVAAAMAGDEQVALFPDLGLGPTGAEKYPD
jgi:hypothetical protein